MSPSQANQTKILNQALQAIKTLSENEKLSYRKQGNRPQLSSGYIIAGNEKVNFSIDTETTFSVLNMCRGNLRTCKCCGCKREEG